MCQWTSQKGPKAKTRGRWYREYIYDLRACIYVYMPHNTRIHIAMYTLRSRSRSQLSSALSVVVVTPNLQSMITRCVLIGIGTARVLLSC